MTLEERMNFFHPTDLITTDSLGYVKVSQHVDLRCVIKSIIMIKIYRTIILPVVLYGCETWTLTLREEYRLRVFENRV